MSNPLERFEVGSTVYYCVFCRSYWEEQKKKEYDAHLLSHPEFQPVFVSKGFKFKGTKDE